MTTADHEHADLLAAYALDAVDPDEARRIEEHLAICPRCRNEVAEHRETAAYLALGGEDAPEGLWERIDAAIAADDGAPITPPVPLFGGPADARANRGRVSWLRIAAVAAAAAIVAVAGVEINHLDNQVQTLQAAEAKAGLAPLVVSALEGPHTSVELTSATESANVAIAPNGDAYWVDSTLGPLGPNRTYQVWGAVDGHVVSLGLLGPVASKPATFRVERGVSQLMVTSEPSGGTTAPTTPILVAGTVPTTI